MRWPWLLRSTQEREMRWRTEALQDALAAARDQVAYWRGRAERLTDAALVRAGAIHEPTMVDPSPARESRSPFAGMAMSQIPIEKDSQPN